MLTPDQTARTRSGGRRFVVAAETPTAATKRRPPEATTKRGPPVLIALLIAAAAILLSGCASPADPTRRDVATASQLASSASADLKPYYQRLHMEGESNATLNRMRLASAAIQFGQWTDAERNLDEVISAIEALGPADARSRKALEDYHPEDIKKFKGEPHERAMAWFLRGLLYLRKREWDNARACFKSVQMQTPVGKPATETPFWPGARWLEGWCNRQLHEEDAARQCWEETTRVRLPSPAKTDHVLCVFLLGWGPIKVPTGEHGALLGYREGNSGAVRATVEIDHTPRTALPAEDLFRIAQGRGRRGMDDVNADKADTQSATQTAGTVLTAGGAVAAVAGGATDNTTVAAAGLGAFAAGVATQAAASGIQPKADTRAWDLLPARIGILSLTMPRSTRNLPVRFLNAGGNDIGGRTVTIAAGDQPELVLFTER